MRVDSEPSPGQEDFEDVLAGYLSRRQTLRLGLAGMVGALALPGGAVAGETAKAEPGFRPLIDPDPRTLQVPEGYVAEVLLRWGDPLFPDAPAFRPTNLRSEDQARQLGTNADFLGFLPLPAGSRSSDRGLLCISTEFTEHHMMWSGFAGPKDLDGLTPEHVEVMMAAHGLNIVEIYRREDGHWSYRLDSPYNRRVTAATPIELRGPAAGHRLLATSYDATARISLGTLANCSGGLTPWGTWLQAEENFTDYFRRTPEPEPEDGEAKPARPRDRYPVEEVSPYGWERVHDRFDLDKEPAEINRFGYVVEIDPHDPTSMPVKHTALGRFEHEAASVTLDGQGRAVVYMGDDARFEHVYKFVSRESHRPGDQAHNMRLLEEGILHVARFAPDGSGQWLPLVFGHGPLVAANGFSSQAEVVVQARDAASLLGATRMDRPEDIEIDAGTGSVYIALTNNDKRESEDVEPANPRGPNPHGHVLELRERAGPSGTEFEWDLLLACGPPEPGAAAAAETDAHLSCPDNLVCDRDGNLWISTDGQPGKLGRSDGVYVVTTRGEARGRARQFLSAVPDAEVCGPSFTPDQTTFFCAIQHPGSREPTKAPKPEPQPTAGAETPAGVPEAAPQVWSGATFDDPSTRFPDYREGVPPRACVVAVTRRDGGVIGS